MVSLVNILLISLVAGKKINSNLHAAVSSNITHQLSSIDSPTFGLPSLKDIVPGSSNLQKKFTFGSKILEADLSELTGFSKLSPEKVNDFYGILNSGFKSKQINFDLIEAFCSSAQINLSSIKGQLFTLLRRAHLLDNKIKFNFKTWCAKQVKKESIIQLIKKDKEIAKAKQELVAKEIKAILAQFYQIKLESVNPITLEIYLRKVKINVLGCYAIDLLSIFDSIYKETRSCYEIVPVANIIYLPIKEPKELVLVGYSNDEAIQIVLKNSFYDFFSQRVVSLNFSNQYELNAFYLEIESKFKGCGFCIQESKSLINSAISISHGSSGKLSIIEKLLLEAGREFSFDYSSRFCARESISITIGSDISIEWSTNISHGSSIIISREPKKPECETTKPKPTTSESANPKPTTSESANPKPTTSESANPKPTTSELAKPKPTTSESAKPKPTTPESAKPTTSESAKPRPTTSDSVSPKPTTPATPEISKPIPTTPEASKPRPITPEENKPGPSTPELVKPEASNHEVVKPAEVDPVVNKPEVDIDGVNNPEATNNEAGKPEATKPEVANSDVETPEITKPELVNLETEIPGKPNTTIESNDDPKEVDNLKQPSDDVNNITHTPITIPTYDDNTQNQLPNPTESDTTHQIPIIPEEDENINGIPNNELTPTPNTEIVSGGDIHDLGSSVTDGQKLPEDNFDNNMVVNDLTPPPVISGTPEEIPTINGGESNDISHTAPNVVGNDGNDIIDNGGDVSLNHESDITSGEILRNPGSAEVGHHNPDLAYEDPRIGRFIIDPPSTSNIGVESSDDKPTKPSGFGTGHGNSVSVPGVSDQLYHGHRYH